jgi:Aerotolerance regulator N-terminal/von Willebrand factor type A domain
LGVLNPGFLAAAVAVGVPLFLHLFQRHQTRRVSFPALRYLQRTEREHARQIRLRQLLLLLVRVAALLLLVGAGARLVVGGRGASHPSTAVVIVLDNSLSSGSVIGETRVLDRLKARAIETLDEATDEDRFWLLRAGEPWTPTLPASAAEARAAVEATEPTDARGDLDAALARAVELLSTSGFERREIHLLSDLQATAFGSLAGGVAGQTDVVVYTPQLGRPPNHALTGVSVGGGLPPLEGQRSTVVVQTLGAPGDTTSLPVRVVIDDRVRSAATIPPGSGRALSLPPTGSGWVRGYADTDPDALRADDRRYFSYRSRPPARVRIAGDPGLFVREAIAVLREAGRIEIASASDARFILAADGEALGSLRADAAALITPPADPTRLPALNRRLAQAGVPWRFDASTPRGEATLAGRALPDALADVKIRARYGLSLTADPGPAPTRTLAETPEGPWAIEGTTPAGGSYLLIASPLDVASSSLPVSTGLVRFIDWATSGWAGAGRISTASTTGDRLDAPRGATRVRLPSGDLREIDGTRTVSRTGRAGFYTFLADDSVVEVAALNPPVAESRLEPLARSLIESTVGGRVVMVRRDAGWRRAVFRSRRGPELWWPLLLAALLLLAVEIRLAASGRVDTRPPHTYSVAAPGEADVAS